MTATTKLGIALLILAGFSLGVASPAAADNQEYLPDISSQGIPVSDVNRELPSNRLAAMMARQREGA